MILKPVTERLFTRSSSYVVLWPTPHRLKKAAPEDSENPSYAPGKQIKHFLQVYSTNCHSSANSIREKFLHAKCSHSQLIIHLNAGLWLLTLRGWKVNWSTRHERGRNKKSEPPTGIEPMPSWTSGGHGFVSCRGLRFYVPRSCRRLISSLLTFHYRA